MIFSYTFGLARAPVLSVFASTVLTQLAALFLIKECVEKLFDIHQDHHDDGVKHSDRLFVFSGCLLGFAVFWFNPPPPLLNT